MGVKKAKAKVSEVHLEEAPVSSKPVPAKYAAVYTVTPKQLIKWKYTTYYVLHADVP